MRLVVEDEGELAGEPWAAFFRDARLPDPDLPWEPLPLPLALLCAPEPDPLCALPD